jgi:hypothetical protein
MSRFRPSRNYISGEFVITGGPVDITGDLVVSGTITANQYDVNVINTNVTHIDADGNTKFGDTPDDTHQFTGSVLIDGDVFIVGAISASAIIGGGATTPDLPLTSVQFNEGGAFGGDPNFTWDLTANALTVLGDITASSNISGAFFYGDGTGITGITATAVPAGSNTQIQFNADGITGADSDLVWASGSNALTVTGDITASSNISGAFFYGDGSGLTNVVASATPAGSNTQIQFNADGVTDADADFTWLTGSNTLSVTGDISASVNISGSEFYGDGSNLADLNASNISAGTLNNARLPATVSVTNVTASSLVSASFLYGDGSNLTNLPAGSPGGLDTQIQFNDAGTFNGDAEFTWNKTTNTLTVTGDISASVNVSGSDFYGGGANLTDLNASNISAGTLNNARLPATISVTNITASALVSSSFFYGDGSNLTNLPSAAITTYNSASAGRVITSVNATTVEGEPNLTFDNTTLVITGDVSGSGNVSGSAFYGDGSNLTGLARDFGPSATDPVGSPNAGDFYYNTVLNMTMHYDSSRTKWLSAETSEIHFGRNGNTGVGAYYRGINGRSYSAIQGRYAEHNGTIVSFSYTRGDTDAAVFNVTSGGTTVSFLSSSVIGGSTETLSDDFAADTVLGVRNQSADGNTTTDVLGVARMKWRI